MANDWKCVKCGGINPGKRTSCMGCNSPKGDSDPKKIIREEYISKINGMKKKRDIIGLLLLLNNPESYVRAFSAEALGEIRAVESIAPIIKLLGDTDLFVRMNATQALGNIRDKQAVNSLLSLLEAPDIVRGYALSALRKIHDEKTLIPIMELVNDKDPSIRRDVACALGEFGNNIAVPRLILALKDPDKGVRESAASALGKIKDISASPALVEALNAAKDNKWVFEQALRGMQGSCKHELESTCKCKLCKQTIHLKEKDACYCKRCGKEINHELKGCKCIKCGKMVHDWNSSGVYDGYFYHCKRCRSYKHSQTGSITEIT
jgi:HEAT repeat protein